jgi:hypothetical protein
MSEIRPPIVVEDDEIREIWAEVMREMSRHGIETKLSKWELVFLVREIHRGEKISPTIIAKRESAVDSLIRKLSEERKNG